MIHELPEGAPRLSLRWAGGGAARDVVGHLLAANDEWYVVLPEEQGPVWVPRAEAEGVRRIPPRTLLATSRPADIERVLERSRPSVRRARLGGWSLGDGHALALGDPGLPVEEAVDAVAGWCGGPVAIRTLPGDLADALRDIGWEIGHAAAVLTAAAPASPLIAAVPLTRGWAVEVSEEDVAGLTAALGAGYVARYRAITLTLL